MQYEAHILEAKILIVDDNPVNVLLLSKILESEGYVHITATSNPLEVTELYRRNRFDIILLDLLMPEMDGFAVMAELRKIEITTYLPILILTAETDRAVRVKALQAGAKDFITKPFDQLEVLTRIANMIQVRLLHNRLLDQNRSLEEVVQQRTMELTESRLDIIQRLARAAEYRDNETGAHIVRISRYCQIVGRAAGLSESACLNLLHASPMHDIGKIGIPDYILLKKGKLTDEEWVIMRKHTLFGADILANSNSDLLEMGRQIALGHHEKWDGSGYPYGLRGEEIPLVARIVAVCDVYDALTSERPYKKAWTNEEAMGLIKRESGQHFDPAIVEYFVSSFELIEEVRLSNPNPPENE